MNPGWRTIKLHGGEPAKTVATGSAGVDVTLLLPSPPIVFVPWASDPPPIPFHLHFHSSLPHALATFSDPKQSNFVIRLMRVATMRIGTEREIRRMEVPAKVEIWQEGGPKIVLSDPRAKAAAAAGGATGAGWGASAMPGGVPPPVNPSNGNASVASPSTGSSPVSTARRGSTSGSGTETRRQSFLRRLSLDRSDSRDAPPAPASLQRQPSNLAATATAVPTVAEEPESTTTDTNGSSEESSAPTTTTSHDDPLAPQGEVNPASPESPLAPLSLSSTDVHFLGQLTISYPTAGPELLRRLVQSFMTPEIGITYVLEVGLQPNAGAVKEAFKHVWGGGMVEVVLGARPTVTDDAQAGGASGVNLRPSDGMT